MIKPPLFYDQVSCPLQRVTVQVAETQNWSVYGLAQHSTARLTEPQQVLYPWPPVSALSCVFTFQPCFEMFLLPSVDHFDILDTGGCLNINTRVITVSCSLTDVRNNNLAVIVFSSLLCFAWYRARRLTVPVDEMDTSHNRIKCYWLYLLHKTTAYQALL